MVENNFYKILNLCFFIFCVLLSGAGSVWGADVNWYAETVNGNSSLLPGTTEQLILKLKATNIGGFDYDVNVITVTSTGNPLKIEDIVSNTINLWKDVNGTWENGVGDDVCIATSTFSSASPSIIIFSLASNKSVPAGSTRYFYITYDLKNNVTEGHTIDVEVNNTNDISMSAGATVVFPGGAPLNSSGTPSYDTIEVIATKYVVDNIGTQLAGKPFEVKVSAVDDNGNIDSNYSGATVNITGAGSNEPGIAPDGTTPIYPAPHTWQGITDGGIKNFEVILYKAESSRQLKIDDGAITGESKTFNVDPGIVFNISIPQSAVIGEGIDIGIQVDEPYGNDFSYDSTVQFSSSDGQAVLPNDFTFIPPERNKIFSKGIIFKTQGTQTITLTDSSNSKINALKSVLVQPENIGHRSMNYPNPFDPGKEKTTLQFYMRNEGKAEIKIYTLTGDLVNEWKIDGSQGVNTVFQWDGRDKKNDIVKSGTYLCLIKADGKKETIKIAVVK